MKGQHLPILVSVVKFNRFSCAIFYILANEPKNLQNLQCTEKLVSLKFVNVAIYFSPWVKKYVYAFTPKTTQIMNVNTIQFET